MAKRHPFKKVKPGESILVTARQLESFMLEHNASMCAFWGAVSAFVHKLSLWAEPEDINHYGNDFNKTFYHLVNR